MKQDSQECRRIGANSPLAASHPHHGGEQAPATLAPFSPRSSQPPENNIGKLPRCLNIHESHFPAAYIACRLTWIRVIWVHSGVYWRVPAGCFVSAAVSLIGGLTKSHIDPANPSRRLTIEAT